MAPRTSATLHGAPAVGVASPRHASATPPVIVTVIAGLLLALAAAFPEQAASAPPPSAPCTTVGTASGTSGDDHMCGTAGANSMNGLGGSDRLTGEGGNDTLNGGDGDDIVNGGVGDDIIVGGLGNDRVTGGDDNDQLRMRDGQADTRTFSPTTNPCGHGLDSVDLDLFDFLVFGSSVLSLFGCERITVGAVDEGPNVVISRRTPKIKDNGKVPVRLKCPDSLLTPCAGTLQLGRSENSQGSPKAYSVDPGTSDKVAARLSLRDRRKLSRRGAITARSTSVESGEFGDKTTLQTLKLRRKPR